MKRIFWMALLLVASAPHSACAFTLSGGSGVQGWETNRLVVNVNPTDCPVAEADLDAAVDTAVGLWNSIPTSRITLVRGTNSVDTPATVIAGSSVNVPLIVCDKALSADIKSESNYIPASTSFQTHNLHINYAYILLNAETGKEANIGKLPKGVLAIIIAHELGHVLGLGHTSSPDSLMYFDASKRNQLTLSQDDMDGITYLYPRDEPFGGAFMGCGTMTSGSGRKPGGRSGPGPGPGALQLALWAGICALGVQALKSFSRREKAFPI